MKKKDIIIFIFMGVLTICALIFTGFILKDRFFSTSSDSYLYLKKRKILNWRELKLKGKRLGPVSAPIQIVEFSDYQCSFCKQVLPALKAIRQKYPAKVSVVLENFPLKMHQNAFSAAIAAECARRQGAFIAYHDSLFANQSRLDRLSYMRLATRISIKDTAIFHHCVEHNETIEIVKSGNQLADKLDIYAIPTFIVNDMLVIGALSNQQLDHLVQQALAKAEP